MTKYTFEELKEQINFYKQHQGRYRNYIIASILRQTAETLGVDIANQLIEVCNLEDYGWHKEV